MAWYDEPKYNRTLSSAGYLLFCLLYVVASVLPFLMLAFAAGVALGLFSGRVLLVMARADTCAPGASVGYVKATRTTGPRSVRTGGAGRLARRAPCTVRAGHACQPPASWHRR